MLTQYGKDYDLEAPVKLLDKLLHEMPQFPDEQIVVISQVLIVFFIHTYDVVGRKFNWNCYILCYMCSHLVKLFLKVLVADINIGYEDIVNTQVSFN